MDNAGKWDIHLASEKWMHHTISFCMKLWTTTSEARTKKKKSRQSLCWLSLCSFNEICTVSHCSQVNFVQNSICVAEPPSNSRTVTCDNTANSACGLSLAYWKRPMKVLYHIPLREVCALQIYNAGLLKWIDCMLRKIFNGEYLIIKD